jgi:hypothetical protein
VTSVKLYQGVVFVKEMAVFTKNLTPVYGSQAIASVYILPFQNHLHVIGIHARSVLA